MELNDVLKIGEVCEVSGRIIKAGIYANKNSEYLNFKGAVVKNISIGSYVLIRKGFANIIGKVEGEYMKEDFASIENNNRKFINRIVGIGILGAIENDRFVHGVTNLPMIGNYVYVVTEDIISNIFAKNAEDKVRLGTLIGYEEYPFEVNVQDLICSHIGVFGNTGSGKSNTLAKLYREIIQKYSKNSRFNQNSKFIIIDFNGEYSNVFDKANVYKLTTRSKKKGNSDRYPITKEDVIDSEFWSIILEATDKTQKPFIERCIRKLKKLLEDSSIYDRDSLAEIIYNSNDKIVDCRTYLKEIFYLLGIEKNFSAIEEKLMYNYKYKTFYVNNRTSVEYGTTKNEIYRLAFGDLENEIFDTSKLDLFEKFKLVMYWNYCEEIGKAFITKEHIGPLMARSNNKIDSLSKIFFIQTNPVKNTKNVDVVSLVGLRIDMRKIVPLIICKKLYSEKKEAKQSHLETSLHIIVDEAHNILSNTSIRESEEWKDYRLECFEEIIKEGRKFGTFLTISSQRPSDISDTIISQLHNYFIHRLVNEEDLRKIYRTIAFSDKSTNEMISILPAGGCVFAGLASNFPILARISILPSNNQPHSENVEIKKIWR